MPTIPVRDGRPAIVDECDYTRLAAMKWRFRNGYVIATVATGDRRRPRRVTMHQLVLQVADGLQVDHRDRDVFNNTRGNLRPATRSQNAANRSQRAHSSRFRGVTWHRGVEKWQATICSEGLHRYLGVFSDETEAALAYDAAALRYHGEFASLNFVGGAS